MSPPTSTIIRECAALRKLRRPTKHPQQVLFQTPLLLKGSCCLPGSTFLSKRATQISCHRPLCGRSTFLYLSGVLFRFSSYHVFASVRLSWPCMVQGGDDQSVYSSTIMCPPRVCLVEKTYTTVCTSIYWLSFDFACINRFHIVEW